VANRLQELSDQEAGIGFKNLNEYEPGAFIRRLGELDKFLPAASP
jgi:hypothetical protein